MLTLTIYFCCLFVSGLSSFVGRQTATMRVLLGSVLHRFLTTTDRRRWSTTARRTSVVVNNVITRQPVRQRVTLTTQQQQQPSAHRRIIITNRRPATAAFHYDTAQQTQPMKAAPSPSPQNSQVSIPISE